MGDYSLSREEMIALGVAAFLFICVPSMWVIIRNRRRSRLTGYRPRAHGYSVAAVMLCLVPTGGALLAWFLLSAGILGAVHEQLHPKLVGGLPWMLFVLDIGALAITTHLFMPAGYLQHLQDTPKGMHGPLDWLFGLVLTVVFFPPMVLQILYVIGLGASDVPS